MAIASDTAKDQSGADAKQVIDTQLVPPLRSYDSKLAVTLATCPDKVDVSGQKPPYCTITVNNVLIDVPVVYDAASKKLLIPEMSFYEFDQIERLEDSALKNDYGVTGDVHCGEPRYRLMLVGTVFTCSVTGSTAVSSLRFRAESGGNLFTFNPTGLSSPTWITTATAQHQAGKATILEGPTIEKWILSFVQTSPAPGQPTVQVHCPQSVDVSGTNHAICMVNILGHDVRREVFVDPVKGVDTRTLDVPVDLSMVQSMTQKDLNDRLAKGGNPTDGVVQCKSGVIVVTPPATFTCDATGGGKAYKVEISVSDTRGNSTWRFVSVDASPAPTSTPSSRP